MYIRSFIFHFTLFSKHRLLQTEKNISRREFIQVYVATR